MTEARAQSTAAQLRAAHPEASVFVEANAGSGKTRVLVTRVIRLLLAGAPLQRLVCLTFTRAAAAEMASRIFDTLAGWTPLDDATLADCVRADCGVVLDADGLVRARRLFARAIETPGGLKVQTIHSFCESILQRFPVEAGIPPGFRVLEEADADALLQACLDAVIDRAVAGGEPRLGKAFDRVVPHLDDDRLRDLAAAVLAKEEQVRRMTEAGAGAVRRQLRRALGCEGANDPDWTIDEARYRAAADVLRRAPAKTDLKRAAAIDAALAATSAEARRAALNRLCFDSKGSPRNPETFVTRKSGLDPAERAFLTAELSRLAIVEDRARAVELCELTEALLAIAVAVSAAYRTAKTRRGAVDFADLIGLTRNLLDSGRAAFVLYKLDGGIDHILIDEAQDTSPAQWSIVERLCEEFFAGEGARAGTPRSVFAVGDPKQSIFSFQGADPHRFAEHRELFAARVSGAGGAFAAVPLLVSWRSSPLILKAVDRVLALPGMAGQVASGSHLRPHEAVHAAMPGLVELWSPPAGQPGAVRDPWWPPPPGGGLQSPEREEALRIAGTIRRWIDTGERVAPGGPPIRYGGILVLVRRRRPLMDEIVRALRAQGIPVAGADRLRLLDHIAVQDLLAAARAALLPQDELSLAEALKGPLFDFDDEDLMALCLGRGARTLWDRLRQSTHARYAAAARRIEALAAAAAASGPYTFFAGLLVGDGRRRMIARLGPDACEPIDELLTLALQQETAEALSLSRFMGWIATADPVIRRDMESAGEVRVMTVHGAKGLEADVVILADTATPPEKTGGVLWDQDTPVWRVAKRFDCAALERLKTQAHASAMAEYQRLLYVALTRARHRLVVTAHAAPKPESWHATVSRALDDVLAPVVDEDGRVIARRWVEGADGGVERPPPGESPPGEPPPAPPPPAWITASARRELRHHLSPSGFGKADPGRAGAGGGERGRKRGAVVHRLLDALAGRPAHERADAGRRWLQGESVPQDEARSVLSECLAVLDDPRLSVLFGRDSLGEAALTGRLALSGRDCLVSGRADRLAIDGDTIWIADFKSDATPSPPGAAPQPYVAQLALYRRLLREIYPGKSIRAAIVWTAAPRLDELAEADMESAFAAALPAEA